MESKTISGLSVDRVKGIVSSALLKFFGNDSQRLKVYQGGNRLNFCCPYCGDSRDAKKKRGNLYLLNLSGDETKVLGLQIRPVVKKNGGSKYYTYKLSGIYKNYKKKDKKLFRLFLC